MLVEVENTEETLVLGMVEEVSTGAALDPVVSTVDTSGPTVLMGGRRVLMTGRPSTAATNGPPATKFGSAVELSTLLLPSATLWKISVLNVGLP